MFDVLDTPTEGQKSGLEAGASVMVVHMSKTRLTAPPCMLSRRFQNAFGTSTAEDSDQHWTLIPKQRVTEDILDL
jgi:hypothetical protein